MNNTPNKHSIKPSDAVFCAFCTRYVWLDNKVELEQVASNDEFEHLIIGLGLQQENAVLATL